MKITITVESQCLRLLRSQAAACGCHVVIARPPRDYGRHRACFFQVESFYGNFTFPDGLSDVASSYQLGGK
jgi:hypothetical protein